MGNKSIATRTYKYVFEYSYFLHNMQLLTMCILFYYNGDYIPPIKAFTFQGSNTLEQSLSLITIVLSIWVATSFASWSLGHTSTSLPCVCHHCNSSWEYKVRNRCPGWGTTHSFNGSEMGIYRFRVMKSNPSASLRVVLLSVRATV